MTERIPQEELDAAYRNLIRRVAAHIIAAMADSDMSFADIAARLGEKEAKIRKFVYDMIDGTSKEMREASDLARALNCRIEFSLRKIEPALPQEPPAAQPE